MGPRPLGYHLQIDHQPFKQTQLLDTLRVPAAYLSGFPTVDGLGRSATLASCVRLWPGGGTTMGSTDALICHCSLAALLPAPLGPCLAARYFGGAEDNEVGFGWFHTVEDKLLLNRSKYR